ncbi:MAG: hypothetical protein LBV52_02270 [Spirochaetaceae bacterium]|jgi:hypothetical protein|nr:hypothetical protein [Spirochaetaceae bacterium]
MKDIIVHQINVAHYRLVELTKLANQAKPFYDWVERIAKQTTGYSKSLSEILFSSNKEQIKEIITASFSDKQEEKPLLFDGIGRVYEHTQACFYFFAWLIRDAPHQRLAPLISRMQKTDNVQKIIAETDTLVELIYQYRDIVKTFEWQTIREVIIDRLEGSRRSISGHKIEAYVRTSLVAAIQHYYSIYNNYGRFKKISIADNQIKIGRDTIDVSAQLFSKNSGIIENILILVKTRETEGGGHAHLFTRDIMSAITEVKINIQTPHLVVVIIAENWSSEELVTIDNTIDIIFHFNMSPNKFSGFDDESQQRLNKYIESLFLLNGGTK